MKRILLAIFLAIGCAMPQASNARSFPVATTILVATQRLKLPGFVKGAALVVGGLLRADRLAAHGVLIALRHNLAQPKA